MKTKAALATVLALYALSVGCAMPTPVDRRAADEARAESEVLLTSFAEALRLGDPSVLDPLLWPRLKPREVRFLERKLATASWMDFYADYRPELQEPLADLSWRAWRRGEVSVKVPYADPGREETEDEFQLIRAEGKWYIRDFALKTPKPGDPINPPDDVRALLSAKAAEYLRNLREGHFMAVLYELPTETASRYRFVDRPWWKRLFSDVPRAVYIMADLERVQRFTVRDWPAPDEIYFVCAPGDGVMAAYDVYYTWPEGGISELDRLQVGFVFLIREEGWSFYQLRFSGKGIDYSD